MSIQDALATLRDAVNGYPTPERFDALARVEAEIARLRKNQRTGKIIHGDAEPPTEDPKLRKWY